MNSLRRQLTLWMMAVLVLLYGLAAVFCYARTKDVLNRQFDAALVDRGRALCALVVREPTGRLEVMPAEATMPEFGTIRHAQYLQIWDADGKSLQRSPSLRGSDISVPEPDRSVVLWDVKLPNGRPGRGVWVRFVPGIEDEHDTPVAPPPAADARSAARQAVSLALLRDRTPVSQVERVLLSSLVLTFALLCAGTVLGVPFVVERGLRPLRRLSHHAGEIDVTSLSARFPVDGLPAELRPIAERLNDLLERLEAGFRRERRFSADVAHELRTPIAELRALAEVAIRWPGDGPAARQAFEDALDVARRMENVVTTLLALARFDSGRLKGNFEPVDLCDAVREAWRPLAMAAESRDLAVTLSLPEAAPVAADDAMLGAIATNLLSNAVTYCPTGGIIECAVRTGPTYTELCVSNTNDSINPQDLDTMLQPFWRKDTSRADGSHSGLGLALVSAYAKVLGASFDVSLTPGGLFRATLRFLPCRPAPIPTGRPAITSLA